MDMDTVCHGRPDVRLEQATQSHLDAQEHGCKLAKKWAEPEGNPCVTTSLPLCTLVVEIVDRGEQVTLVLHRPPETMESQSLRKLYDYVEFCTPTSNSCVLFLCTNHPFGGIFKRDHRTHWSHSRDSVQNLVLGLRILPPPASRRPFVNPPEELLHMIFNEAKLVSENWRKLMLSLALVCRAWSRPALDTMYEDFGYSRDVMWIVSPYASRLAETLEYYPALGKKIRVLDTRGFRSNAMDRETEEDYLEYAKAVLTILQTAKSITRLHLFDTHRVLAQDFMHTLYSCSNVRELVSKGPTDSDPYASYEYIPNIGDILWCLSHWPLVCRLELWHIPSAIALNDLPTSTCTITRVSLHSISLDLSQLRLLTTSWKSALREARINDISGITNEEFRMWLSEVGPSLESLHLSPTIPRHRSNNEEYALDAMLPIMSNLVSLNIQGDVASHLVLERFAPTRDVIPGRRYKLCMRYMRGMNPDGFLNALNTTAWTEINEIDLLWNHGELSERARGIATRRNICVATSRRHLFPPQ